jgi:anhydro-N-acetylmuramic acid kinase
MSMTDPVARLAALRRRRRRVVVGLLSGTSCDAIDAAAVAFEGRTSRRWRLIAYRETPWPDALRRRLLALQEGAQTTAAEVAALHHETGELFGRAAARVAAEVPGGAHLVGSHGQTVAHRPPSSLARGAGGGSARGSAAAASSLGAGTAATLQIGEPARIAAAAGLPVVANFRAGDAAVGGEGAPLAPVADALLLTGAVPRAAVNIGGISNLTLLPARGARGRVVAYDAGPGMALLDHVIRTRSRARIDRDGRRARAGTVQAGLLRRLSRHPYFSLRRPKTAGRDTFSPAWLDRVLQRTGGDGIALNDLLATLAALTADALADALLAARPRPREVLLSGGGARHAAVRERLRVRLGPGIALNDAETAGVPSEGKEAILFALLAHEWLWGRAVHLPGATGARRPALLGQLAWPPEPRSGRAR